MMLRLIVASVVSLLLVSCSDLLGPRTYDECILKAMKGVTSDAAARQVSSSCRSKFSGTNVKNPESRKLTGTEVRRLDGRLGLEQFARNYSGEIYNGNQSVTVSEISFMVRTVFRGVKSERVYTTGVHIRPLTTAYVNFPIIVGVAGSEYSWSVVSGSGF